MGGGERGSSDAAEAGLRDPRRGATGPLRGGLRGPAQLPSPAQRARPGRLRWRSRAPWRSSTASPPRAPSCSPPRVRISAPTSSSGEPGNPLAASSKRADPAAAAEGLRWGILDLQAAMTAIEGCRKQVIAAVHGACVGGGVEVAAACDIRYCSMDATFVLKEVDMAIVADLGVLQRLPRIIDYGNTAELALTGRTITAVEAEEMGLVSRVFNSKQELDAGVSKIAKEIAEKSALSVMGTKAVLLRSRDVTVEQGLEHVSTWNAAMLRSNDLKEAVNAFLEALCNQD